MRTPVIVVVAALGATGLGVVVLGACSPDPDDRAPDSATVDVGSPPPVPGGAPPGGAAVAPTSELGTDDPNSGTGGVTAPPTTFAVIPEAGVPGLDSADAFCAAWSRFGGSFQVVAVSAAFGAGDAASHAALEVVAAPTVTRAHAAMAGAWPTELDAEREAAIEQRFGPFASRGADALEALEQAGADESVLDELDAAWIAALAGRDPESPDVVVDLSDDVWSVVDLAAASLLARRGAFGDDATLVTDVATPQTDRYLAASCPDQGTLLGGEVTQDAG